LWEDCTRFVSRERIDIETIVSRGQISTSGKTITDISRPFTPYCGIKLAELAQKHFPPGVFQALSGEDNIGPMLTEHPDIDKVSFTGSTETGKRVLQSCSKTMKRVTLEL
jgi:hypothetical protein